jgi:crossover junction endodeoxyribonuclease RusA
VTAAVGVPGRAIRITVLGKPAPQGSKRYIGRGRMIESSKAAGPWRDKIAAETRRAWGYAEPQAGPVAVTVEFFFARPAAHFGTGRNRAILKPGSPTFPIGRTGDVDKLVRAVLDGITIGRAIADDAQVVQLEACKRYAETPRATITIREM